jgi:hypothetical protein
MKLAKDFHERKSMGMASKELGKQFRWSETTKELVGFLKEKKGKRSLKRRFFMVKAWVKAFFRMNIPALLFKSAIKKWVPERFWK